MAGLTIAALADDLTGAAEIAAIGKRHGLSTHILTAASTPSGHTGLTVHDSDSRLLSPAEAAQRVTLLGSALAAQKPAFVFKKTDSVLRGNVVAEVVALARSLGLRRVLLAPANPSLGRTITQGQYYIQGVPINQTSFAHDPHHPAKSSSVADLLGSSPDWPVSIIKAGAPLPDHGIAVAEARSSAEVEAWAKRMDKATLAAGGAEFFMACLKQLGLSTLTPATLAPQGPNLVVTGSLTPARQKLLEHAQTRHWPIHAMPVPLAREHFEMADFIQWFESLAGALNATSLAVTESPKFVLDDHPTAQQIRLRFGQLVRRLLEKKVIGHLIVEGGATAAAISEAAGWTRFDVAGDWAPGVIALRPTNAPQLLFTIKPGSYSWPENLWQLLDTCGPTNAHS
jgi:uncharacterized protein YgbK (DUF1537 family)